jgi:predicted NAD/FAD-dependent oxidoreductase
VNCGLQSQSFVSDDELGLYQIGDMVSSYTPGFEGAVLSADEASKHLVAIIKKRMN